MLILNRKFGESITIADDITIIALGAYHYDIKLGISAPRSMPVRREESFRCLQEEQANGMLHEYFSENGMLVVIRAIGEAIMIGQDIRIVPISLQGNQMKIGIKAPEDVKIYRAEIYEKIREERLTNENGEVITKHQYDEEYWRN